MQSPAPLPFDAKLKLTCRCLSSANHLCQGCGMKCPWESVYMETNSRRFTESFPKRLPSIRSHLRKCQASTWNHWKQTTVDCTIYCALLSAPKKREESNVLCRKHECRPDMWYGDFRIAFKVGQDARLVSPLPWMYALRMRLIVKSRRYL